MKNSIYLIALAAFFIFGCNESPNSSPNRVNDPNHPTANDGPNSITDIPTPGITGATTDDGTNSGYMVCLSWNSNTPGSETYSTPPTDANNFNHDAEYWGYTQNSIVGPGSNGHENQPYSGHYEVYRDGVKIADITGNSYCDDDLAEGTYVYTIKSKSLEGVQPNAMTHHSEMSEGFEVTVGGCEATILVTGTGTINTGNMSLNTNSNKNAANFPLKFKLYCNGNLVTDGSVVSIYLNNVQQTQGYSFDGSTNEYHVNLNNPSQGTVASYGLDFYLDGDLISEWTFIVD